DGAVFGDPVFEYPVSGDPVFGAEVIVPSHHVLWISVQQLDHPWTEYPEFVRLYDVENAGMWDFDFYRELAVELGAAQVADIGCGTGVLAVELARRGMGVTGVDPAAAMIEAARSRVADVQLTESVELIEGTAADLEASSSDFAVMVGHVAQYFLHRAQWDE